MKLIKIIAVTFVSVLSSYTLTMEEKDTEKTFFPFENITLSTDEENNKQISLNTYYLPDQSYTIAKPNENVLAGPYYGCKLWVIYGFDNGNILTIHQSFANSNNFLSFIKKNNQNKNQLSAMCVQEKNTDFKDFSAPLPDEFLDVNIDPKKISYYTYINDTKISETNRYVFVKNNKGVPELYSLKPTSNSLIENTKLDINKDYIWNVQWNTVCEYICKKRSNDLKRSNDFMHITTTFADTCKNIISELIEKQKKINNLLELYKKN